jgi:hypothetical protein
MTWNDPRPTHQWTGGSGNAAAGTVRGYAVWAGIAALLLLYFGFAVYTAGLTSGGRIFVHTLRIGGIAMAASTLLLLTGWPKALAFDGLSSIAIGAALFLSGSLMLTSQGGAEAILNLVFGFVFASAGWNELSVFRTLEAPRRRSEPEQVQPDLLAPQPAPQMEQDPPVAAVVAQPAVADGPQADRPRQSAPDESGPRPAHRPPPPAPMPPAADSPQPAPMPPETPEGWLASFADPPGERPTR